jgi:N-carbamoylputrescine amidase
VRSIRAAAIQVRSENGLVHENLANAEPYVDAAAAQGADLIVCPEFLGAGYIYEESIWQAGEPAGGPTEQWLSRLARKHGVHVGAGYLEAEGDEFYNTYALMQPDGGVAGRVRKGSLPGGEGWFFRPDRAPKIIETEFGRIGVGICNDNQTCWFRDAMQTESPDLILMPHSAPTPRVPVIHRWFARTYDQILADTPAKYARALGVPVVMTNKVLTRSTTALPFLPLLRMSWEFMGMSTICAAGGDVLGRADRCETALVREIELNRAKSEVPADRHFYWSFKPPRFADSFGRMCLWLEERGKESYASNPRRREAALRTVTRQSKSDDSGC